MNKCIYVDVCLCECINVCIYCMYACIYVCICVFMFALVNECTCECIYVFINVCLYVFMYHTLKILKKTTATRISNLCMKLCMNAYEYVCAGMHV